MYKICVYDLNGNILTLKFHIVCFALSQATNRYIKSEMKRLIVITLLGKLNEHIYWVNTTFRLLLKIPMVTLYIGVPCWNVASVFQWKPISHYKTVYNDLYFVVLVDTVGNLKDVMIYLYSLLACKWKKNYQGKLQHCAKWYPWNYSAAYNSWTFKIQCAYILPSQFIILSFDLWYTSFNFRIRVYITPLSFRENKIWSTY